MIVTGLFIVWPILFFFFILPGALTGVFMLIEKSKIIEFLSVDTKKVKHKLEDCCPLKLCFIVSYLVFALVYYTYIIAIYLVVGGVGLGLALAFAAVWYAVLLIPSYISFVYVVYKK